MLRTALAWTTRGGRSARWLLGLCAIGVVGGALLAQGGSAQSTPAEEPPLVVGQEQSSTADDTQSGSVDTAEAANSKSHSAIGAIAEQLSGPSDVNSRFAAPVATAEVTSTAQTLPSSTTAVLPVARSPAPAPVAQAEIIAQRKQARLASTPAAPARRIVVAQATTTSPANGPPAGAAQPPAAASPTSPPAAAAPPAAATPAPGSTTLPTVEVIQKQDQPPPAKAKAKPAKKTVAAPQPSPIAAAAAPTISLTQTMVKVSPVGGSEIALEKVPSAVTNVKPEDLAHSNTPVIEDALQSHVPGIIVTDLQGNEFQKDVQFRGFESSPLNGVPQGLAVYQNGVRINESFGDIVNWDFIPEIAINDISVVSGNPVFGLNALGGAIVIGMKDGFNFQGATIDTRAGSFGRRQIAAEAGAKSGAFAAYFALEGIDDDGWRQFSPSEDSSSLRRYRGQRRRRRVSPELHRGQQLRWRRHRLPSGAARSRLGPHLYIAPDDLQRFVDGLAQRIG